MPMLPQSEQSSRRSTLGLLTGALVLAHVEPSVAAYGESANVFGKAANNAGVGKRTRYAVLCRMRITILTMLSKKGCI